VLTGPPGAGKTTTLELLERRGWSVVPEAARRLIQEEQCRRGDVYPWTDLTEFVERLRRAQEEQFHIAEKCASPIFYDRGLPDALAFLHYYGITVPVAYAEVCLRYRYDFIFVMDLLPDYTYDAQRLYTEAEACALAHLNCSAYHDLGYELIHTPVMPRNVRVDFIIRELQHRMLQVDRLEES
jgi:predicted ATPase